MTTIHFNSIVNFTQYIFYTMANLETILSWFQTGDNPTEEEFRQTFSSFRHNDTKIPIKDVDGLESSLNNKLNVNDYVKDGKIRADKIEALGLTDLIESNESNISEFITNFYKYEFQQNDFIAVPDEKGNFSLYLFKGGEKNNKNNYLPTGISNVTIGMVQGLQSELDKKIDLPVTDGNFYIKKSSGLTTTEILVDDTLATVVNKNNYSPKAIAFIEETEGSGNSGKNGVLGANKNTYSFFFGNMNPDHTGVYNIAFGYNSLPSVTSGQINTVMGHYAAKSLTTGGANTVMGYESATGLTTGNDNTLIGVSSGYNLKGGTGNSMFGKWTGCFIAGSSNTFLGYRAGQHWGKGGSGLWSSNIVIGANTSGHPNGIWGENNLILGSNIELIGAQNNRFIINNFLGTANRWYATHFIEGNFADRWLRFDTSLQVLRLPAADVSFTKDVVAKPDGTFGLEDKKDYVPLSGTAIGKPFTGNIELEKFIDFYWHDDNGVRRAISTQSDSFSIYSGSEISDYAKEIQINAERGIYASEDLSSWYSENSFIQKRYVDSKVDLVISNDTQSSSSYTLRKNNAQDGDLSYMKIKGTFDIPANNFIFLEFPKNVDIGIQKVTGKYVDEFNAVQYVDFVVETNADSETRIINNSEIFYKKVIINATLVGVAKNYAK